MQIISNGKFTFVITFVNQLIKGESQVVISNKVLVYI